MANDFLKYTSKDYNSIYSDLVKAIPSITDLWTNTEDGDPGIVLVKLMSALGDMLSYNMDKQALEYYSSTVTQRKNAAKLFNLIGYKMHWYRSATNRIAVHNNIATPYKYSCIDTYNDYITLKNTPNKTPEQIDEMNTLLESYVSEFYNYLAEEFDPTTYMDIYYTPTSGSYTLNLPEPNLSDWQQGNFVQNSYDGNSAYISTLVIPLGEGIQTITRTSICEVIDMQRANVTDAWTTEIITDDVDVYAEYRLYNLSMQLINEGIMDKDIAIDVSDYSDAYFIVFKFHYINESVPMKPLGWTPGTTTVGHYHVLGAPITVNYTTSTHYEVNYNALFTNPSSELLQEYETWKQRNQLSIYTYICSPQKTLLVRNSSRNDAVYILKPTTASNADSSNDYLGSTDDIKPGETHEFDVIQGTLNNMSFQPVRLRNNRFYFPEAAIDEEHMWLSWKSTNNGNLVNSEAFIEKTDNLLTVTDGNIYFEFGVDEFDNPYIELPSYWAEKLGDSVEFTVYYVRSAGVYGNITKDYLDTIEGINRGAYTITHPANTVPYINSDGRLIATPGQHPQTAHEAYIDSLNYITTFNTLVTIFDFERFCKRQQGFANAFAVDGQRANDLLTMLNTECYNMSLAQLQSYYHEARVHGSDMPATDTNIAELQKFYIGRKQVRYSDADPSAQYLPYGLNLHVVYGNFDTAMDYVNDHTPVDGSKIATLINAGKKYWLYQLDSNYTIEYETDPNTDSYIYDDNGNKIPIHHNYESIFDVNGNGRAAHYLDEKFRTTKIVNVCPAYAAVRVFPWRCCGVVHLKYPVTQAVADKILDTIMEHLSAAFHPANIQFGQKIKYMDVINVVTEAHEAIAYFDAGLNSRQLIDVDQSADMTFFNSTSLMYYVQSANGKYIADGLVADKMAGNNQEYLDDGSANPYYKLLSIAPEYILRNN